ncbi:MAG: TAXI family TRAP transporter solute-binding subunit, partial [Alicyclobacillus sp.]|nr:TAXI family TRAP transporter solute-binding subunit [Alicyclobacillus sp.]
MAVWMRWKRWAATVTAGLLVSSVAACGGGASGGGQSAAGNAGGSVPAKTVQEVRMGTSSSGSDYYVLTTGMSNIINKNTQLKTSVVAAGGSDATARAIADNKADMGMLNLWSLTNAFQGKPPFDKPVPVRQVLDGQPTGYYLIARAASGIQTPADLKGKRLIGKRPALQSIDEFTAALLSAYGMTAKDVNLISTADTNEAIQALEQGTVDAAVLPGGVD